MPETIPIACGLTDRELQTRRKDYLDKIAGRLLGSSELENGFSYRFEMDETTLPDLGVIIDLERRCCPFLNFNLNVEAGRPAAVLELTGPEGTKEIIRSLFGWN